MKELFQRLAGRASTVFDRFYYSFGRGAAQARGDLEYDSTGLVAVEPRPIEVFKNRDGVVYAEYDSVYFSLWRAQELTLFSRHMGLIQRPFADLGCGDGSFGSVLFGSVDYGIDNDPAALKAAEGRGIYGKLIRDTSGLPTGSLRSVYSNSVLEHVKELDMLIAEVARVLADDGVFVFTVPVKRYAEDLDRYFGAWYSTLLNRISYHRNMFEPDGWKMLVESHGFAVEEIIHYQPGWFTYRDLMLRFLSPNVLGRIVPYIGRRYYRRNREKLDGMVLKSVTATDDGGNIFVVARKSGAKGRKDNMS